MDGRSPWIKIKNREYTQAVGRVMRARRHAYPVILLGGWLLMLPPSDTKVVPAYPTSGDRKSTLSLP